MSESMSGVIGSGETMTVGVTIGEKTAAAALRKPGTHWDSDDLVAGVIRLVTQNMLLALGRIEEDDSVHVEVNMVDGEEQEPACDAKYEYDLDAPLDDDDLQAVNKGFAAFQAQLKAGV